MTGTTHDIVQHGYDTSSGGATLGPKGALAPPKYLKKLVYMYIIVNMDIINIYTEIINCLILCLALPNINFWPRHWTLVQHLE